MNLSNIRFILDKREPLLAAIPQASEEMLSYMEKDLLSTLQYIGYTTANPYLLENLRSMSDSSDDTTWIYFTTLLKEEALRRLSENRDELERIRKSYCDDLDDERWTRLRETRAYYDSLEEKIINIVDENINLGQMIDDSSPERYAITLSAYNNGLASLEAVKQERTKIVRSMPEITYLPRNYQRKKNKDLTKTLLQNFEWVSTAQEQVHQSILDDTLCLWEITPVVMEVFKHMQPTEEELFAIQKRIDKDKTKKKVIKIGTVALTTAATIACFFLSG
ncbi:MAG: hypothetical protein JW875_10335 [Spirochaetales bacterium]|nr:hypothetical protein [Spirochaetales bacterium]